MSLLTKGQLNVRVYKLSTTLSLDKIHDAAVRLRYPIDRAHQSSGWGSSWDDANHVGERVAIPFEGGTPHRILREDGTAEKLRLRFYWDRLSPTLRRSYGQDTDWKNVFQREALDVIIFDGGDGQHTAVVSTREERYTRSDVVPALNALLTSSDPGASVFSDGHPEELDPDLFLWLLHRHKSVGKQIGHGITITDINEMNSLDSQYRRGRYASGAGVDRVDLLALIAKGQAKLGPAKISVHDDLDPEANFDLQLFHDGGFSVFRSSRYKDHRVAAPTDNTFGHRLVEDVFESILPRIRSEYEADTQWTAEQRASFIAASKVELDVLTSD